MMRKKVYTEENVRMAEFQRKKTLVFNDYEEDVFTSERIPDLQIRVRLDRRNEEGMSPTVAFSSIRFRGEKENDRIIIIDENGRRHDQELREILAWELIDGDERYIEDYSYGRDCARHPNGRLMTTGDKMEHSNPKQEPSFELGF